MLTFHNELFFVITLKQVKMILELFLSLQEDDVTSLNSLERTAKAAFPGFPLIGITAGFIACRGTETLKTAKAAGPNRVVDGLVQEEILQSSGSPSVPHFPN